jgi:hypothetical protein
VSLLATLSSWTICKQKDRPRHDGTTIVTRGAREKTFAPLLMEQFNYYGGWNTAQAIEGCASKRPGSIAAGPFYLFIGVFSDQVAGSRNHDPRDKGGLAGEQQRLGEDSSHVSPPFRDPSRPVWVTPLGHSRTVAKRWRTTALIMY